MRGSSSIFIIIGVFLLLAAGAVGVLMYMAPAQSILASDVAQMPPTTEPMRSIIEAEIDIEEGTVITTTEGLLKFAEVPESQFVAGVNLTSFEEARNMIVTMPIKAGEPVRLDTLRQAGLAHKIPVAAAGEAPLRAYPLQVNNLSGMADLLQPGDFIDVLASFNMDVVTFRPGGWTSDGEGDKYVITEEKTNEGTTKVLLQDVEVLDIIKPAPPVEGEEDAPPPEEPVDGSVQGGNGSTPPPSTPGNTLASGSWVVVIAVTNQEAEVLRFALDRGIGITTVLRGAGDHAIERTVGATMRILVDNYGMPLPSSPQVSQQPLLKDVNGATKLPQVESPAFVPRVDDANR